MRDKDRATIYFLMAAFEQYAQQRGYDLFSHGGDGYNSKRTNTAWRAWQACSAEAAALLAKKDVEIERLKRPVDDNEALVALLPIVWTDKNVPMFNEALQRLKRTGYAVIKLTPVEKESVCATQHR